LGNKRKIEFLAAWSQKRNKPRTKGLWQVQCKGCLAFGHRSSSPKCPLNGTKKRYNWKLFLSLANYIFFVSILLTCCLAICRKSRSKKGKPGSSKGAMQDSIGNTSPRPTQEGTR
jgi:hypothetical protein